MAYYVFTGGGTSGHINPALALIQTMQVKDVDSDILYIGKADGLEAKLVPQQGIAFLGLDLLPISPFNLSLRFFKALFYFYQSRKKCIKLFLEKRPSAVIGTGGYVAAPVLSAAKRLNIPILIQEQNAFLGRANTWLLKKVDSVCVSYKEALFPFLSTEERLYFEKNSYLELKSGQKLIHSSQPLSQDFLTYAKQKDYEIRQNEARKELFLQKEDFVVLALGGSLGARSINQTFIKWWKNWVEQSSVEDIRPAGFLGDICFILGTGSRLFEETYDFALDLGLTWQYKEDKTPFLYYENNNFKARLELKSYLSNIATYMSAADFIFARAGAGVVFEIMALQKTVCFIPYPYAVNDHQWYNAKVLADEKVALLYRDADFNEKILRSLLIKLREEWREIGSYGKKIESSFILEANERIANEILRLTS